MTGHGSILLCGLHVILARPAMTYYQSITTPDSPIAVSAPPGCDKEDTLGYFSMRRQTIHTPLVQKTVALVKAILCRVLQERLSGGFPQYLAYRHTKDVIFKESSRQHN